MQLDDRMISINGTEIWEKLTPKEKGPTSRRPRARPWNISQLMHGEQGALIRDLRKSCRWRRIWMPSSTPPTQVMDEARHVESYSRPCLHEKFELAYPMTAPLKNPARTGLERFALGLRLPVHAGADRGTGPGRVSSACGTTARTHCRWAINAYVMQDEARHVAFGRIALRDYYQASHRPTNSASARSSSSKVAT